MVGNTNAVKRNVLDYANAKSITMPSIGNSYTFTEDGYYFGVVQLNISTQNSACDISICINGVALSFGYVWAYGDNYDRWPAVVNIPVKSGDVLSITAHGTGYTVLPRVSTFIPYK